MITSHHTGESRRPHRIDLDADTGREIWVNFKVFGLLGITLLFVIVQAVFMSKHIEETTRDEDS